MKQKVEGHNNLLRDSETGAIINIDSSGYSSYIMNKVIKDEESIRIQNVEQDLANIQNELSELKTLLKEVLIDFQVFKRLLQTGILQTYLMKNYWMNLQRGDHSFI